ncbi:MAG: aspartate 1-decarboxylase [Cyanobacteria bacterium P01_H01_bin.74]
MIITLLQSKIHRATVTAADLHYNGSITIDADLLELAGLVEYQQVDIYNITRGSRFTTYALIGQRNSGVIKINGAAAHHAAVDDLVIIAAYCQVEQSQAEGWQPKLVFVNAQNQPESTVPQNLPV